MLDRASTFANPEVVRILKTRFIPVAIDQAYQRRQKDAEGRFYQKIANQSPRKVGRGTTQGLFTAGADGSLLGYTNNRGHERTMGLLKSALAKHKPKKVEAIQPGEPDPRYNPTPPKGGIVVRVTSRVLGGYPETTDPWRRIFQVSTGRDNLWVRADETKALVSGTFPDTLMSRLARYHLVDNTRGEPPMWERSEIRSVETKFADGRFEATVHLQAKSGDRSYKTRMLGFVETKNGRITRFDVVARGQFRGHGPYTQNPPPGDFPFAVAFTLADGKDVADRIPPQGSRGWVAGYLR
ncbi:MAG: hypothetical protein H8E37_04845 [Planctomycetes bacterium]|nr:hypothetical protein [Planctomycetota bacterium]